jgi:integrase
MVPNQAKPQKPTPDFPLFPHASRQWAKKVKGKLHYFGLWSDPQAALDRYNAWRNCLREPPMVAQGGDAGKPHPQNGKPRKPHADFPLYAHNAGQWAKRIRGEVHYFGPWSDPQAALDKYLDQKDALLAGRTPTPSADALTVKELVNGFLNSKRLKVESGELKQRTFDCYKVMTDKVVAFFKPWRLVSDLGHTDFERLRSKLASAVGPVCLGNYVTQVRILFKYAFDNGLIDLPMRFGSGFRKPSLATLRRARNKKGPRMFTRKELRAALRAASKPMKAMLLLGINCGFGNTDCATLPVSALKLKRGWLNFPRPKTAVPRRCRLWPETVKALKIVLAGRNSGPVFITKYGHTWERSTHDPISQGTAKLLKEAKIRRKGLNFYALRHTFQTIGEESGDAVAVKAIMGHTPASNDMSAVYRERMTDKRLHAVAAYVRHWLFKKGNSRSSRPAASASAASGALAESSSAAS